MPKTVKSIEDIFAETPALKTFAKYFNTKEFTPLGFAIASQPQSHPNHTIYGLFVLNKDGVRTNLKTATKEKPEIKQDFIALDRVSGRIVYYSGGSKLTAGEHQSMKSFCKTYGKWPGGKWGQYACTSNFKTNQRWYKDESDSNLPAEPEIRGLIASAMKKLRSEVSGSS